MNKENKKIILKKGKEKSLDRFHPWVYSGAVKETDNGINEGDIVSVYSIDEKFIAKGFWQNDSIAVKILTFENRDIDNNFWIEHMQAAVKVRQTVKVVNEGFTDIFRLVNGEGDNLPSLIADFYDGLLVVQFHSVFMYLHREAICMAIQKVMGVRCKAVFNKSSSTLPRGFSSKNEFLLGNVPDELYALENGIKYLIDYKCGQKTGFFIDQRDNRNLLSLMAAGKRVLNTFSYTGGFSLAALRGNAEYVTSVDVSKRAIEICKQNLSINNYNTDKYKDKHNEIVADVTKYLNEVKKYEYDIIILDPPAFAKHQKDLQAAVKAYRELNCIALSKIAHGGLLFTFSCSGVVSSEAFSVMLFSAAALSGRKVRIIKSLGAAADHPQNIFHPEGEYLKGFLLYVE
ncbi:MAG: class I SAM-dependent rRNA methyltransferase [Bacteroidales bacterium]|jgi:23S rRNA (cytosine1962-C5)-methyltransferase|nr:class I SAM-dependent rRNA methyltransferase [Bacteroidales bacterium]